MFCDKVHCQLIMQHTVNTVLLKPDVQQGLYLLCFHKNSKKPDTMADRIDTDVSGIIKNSQISP